MKRLTDVHLQFASWFPDKALEPYFYLLSKKLADGHICIAREDVQQADLPEGVKIDIPFTLLSSHELVAQDQPTQPMVLCQDKLYLQRYYQFETTILNRIISFKQNGNHAQEVSQKLLEVKELTRSLFPATIGQPDWQFAAAISAVLNDFTIITGGPGTGKTTTVAKALAVLYSINKQKIKVALAAPTGKAASRMAEALKNNSKKLTNDIAEKMGELLPSTLHRLLGTRKNNPYFRHDADHPLPYDVVIVDESSMIDVALFAKLLDAIGPGTKLILLGDKNQLAAVEAGSLFGDLCQAQQQVNLFGEERARLLNELCSVGATEFPAVTDTTASAHPLFQQVIELQHSYRFSSDGGIGKFSRAVINNDESAIRSFFGGNDETVTITDEENVLEQFAAGYEAYIRETDIKTALQKFNQLRVLCAIREGSSGLYQVNKRIESYLHAKRLIQANTQFYEHMPVMITQNNYELELYNGDIGILRMDEEQQLKAWFEQPDGTLKGISPAYIPASEKVYAMTIHKSQGSEFDQVLVVLPGLENNQILTRELLYTAVTRAKQQLVILAAEDIILRTADLAVKRSSGLVDRLSAPAIKTN